MINLKSDVYKRHFRLLNELLNASKLFADSVVEDDVKYAALLLISNLNEWDIAAQNVTISTMKIDRGWFHPRSVSSSRAIDYIQLDILSRYTRVCHSYKSNTFCRATELSCSRNIRTCVHYISWINQRHPMACELPYATEAIHAVASRPNRSIAFSFIQANVQESVARLNSLLPKAQSIGSTFPPGPLIYTFLLQACWLIRSLVLTYLLTCSYAIVDKFNETHGENCHGCYVNIFYG